LRDLSRSAADNSIGWQHNLFSYWQHSYQLNRKKQHGSALTIKVTQLCHRLQPLQSRVTHLSTPLYNTRVLKAKSHLTF
jgi:hypothetical protein